MVGINGMLLLSGQLGSRLALPTVSLMILSKYSDLTLRNRVSYADFVGLQNSVVLVERFSFTH